MEYTILPVTDNEAFNYFFSLPFWLFVIESAFILGMSAFTYLKDQI